MNQRLKFLLQKTRNVLCIAGGIIAVLLLGCVGLFVLLVIASTPPPPSVVINATRTRAHQELEAYCTEHNIDITQFPALPLMARACCTDAPIYYALYCSDQYQFYCDPDMPCMMSPASEAGDCHISGTLTGKPFTTTEEGSLY